MDSRLIKWAICAVIAFIVLCSGYLFLNRGSNASAASSGDKWTVYGSKKCGWTVKQLNEMDTKGIQYSFVDCDSQECEGVSGFPTLKGDDGTVKVGFTPM
jgi:hypothetical protein